MKLNFKSVGQGRPLFILHGLFGSGDNWQSFAKSFDGFECFLIDQRNHGNSPHSSEMNYSLIADDLKELMNDLGLEKINILGHSMGGKSAMFFASRFPEHVEKLVIVDISPKKYKHHHVPIIQALRELNLNVKSRVEVDRQLAEKIEISTVRQFLLKNLKREKNGFSWKLHLENISKNYSDLIGFTEINVIENETLFISGGDSPYIQKTDEKLIYSLFPNSKIKTILGAGHWVHSQKPAETLALVKKFF
jgi:pimeloyl-ACP methyl ester carboxylesterase